MLDLARFAPFIRAVALGYKVKMERDKGPKHNSNDSSEHYDCDEHFVILQKEVKDDPVGSLKRLASRRPESLLKQFSLVAYVHHDHPAADTTVSADQSMKEEEA